MVYLAEGWADPAILVAIASVIATVITGIVAAVVTLRTALPKRRLGFYVNKLAQLMSPSTGLSDGRLVVAYDGNVLVNPYIVEIQMLNQTGKDIPANLFDSGAPIVLDLGVPIIELIETAWEDWNDGTPVRHTPQATPGQSNLTMEPTLIPGHLMTTFTLLVEGEPRLDYTIPLIDVKVEFKDRPTRRRRSSGDGIDLNRG
ncbi:hypothetical protein [Streptomyces sp. NPDC002785]|uniref:hypothetical protein n=1 Tax=Streptomyces sp. NPDC002785 TaxID=3154543 RepID=UPI00332C1688